MIDIAADEGWLATTLRIMHLVQMCVQGRWISDASIMTLPYCDMSHFPLLKNVLKKLLRVSSLKDFSSLPEFLMLYQQDEKLFKSLLNKVFEQRHANEVCS